MYLVRERQAGTDLISTGAGIKVDVVQLQELHTKRTLKEKDSGL